MIAFLLALSVAGAMEPPPPPEPVAPVAGQCSEAIGVQAGTLAPCRGVLLPTSWAADLQAQVAWGQLLADSYRIDTATLEGRLTQEQAARAELQRAADADAAWWRQPSTVFAVGAVAGVAATIGIAAALDGAL